MILNIIPETFASSVLKRCLVFLTFFLAIASPSFGGSITAELESSSIPLGEQTSLTISINGNPDQDFELPQIEGLEFRQAGTSTNVQMINGSFSRETVFTIEITATRAGEFKIPSIKVKIGKEEVASAPLTLTVSQGAGNQSGTGRGGPAADAQGDSPISIEREISKANLYEGEAVKSTVRIFQRIGSRVRSIIPERDSAPEWRIVTKDGQRNYQTAKDGVPYQVTELTEVLIPLKSGTLNAPMFSVRATYIKPSRKVQRRGGNLWDMFGGGVFETGEEVSKKISSASQKLSVKALPTENRPNIVSDIVGDFNVKVNLSKSILAVQETATLTIKISGQGVLDRILDPKSPVLIGAKVYAEKAQISEKIDENGLYSEKIWKYAIVPNSSGGDLNLGKIEFGSFDPYAGKWKTLAADLGNIKIQGNQGQSLAANNGSTSQPNSPSPGLDGETSTADDSLKGDQKAADIPGLKSETTIKETSLTLQNWITIVVGSIGLLLVLIFVLPIRKIILGSRSSNKKVFASLVKEASKLDPSRQTLESLQTHIHKLKALAAKGSDLSAEAMTPLDLKMRLIDLGVSGGLADRIKNGVESIETLIYREQEMTVHHATEILGGFSELAHIEVRAKQ